MKIIPFKQKGKEFLLQDELNLKHDLDGVQVSTEGVRVFVTERKRRLTIRVIDGATKAEGNVKDNKGLVLSKPMKVRQEV